MFQTAVIELSERLDKPLYCIERFIEGDYTKYNSNSGFVSPEFRHTPHAFSHFTFERSGHRLIVVDVQGQLPALFTVLTYSEFLYVNECLTVTPVVYFYFLCRCHY